MTGHTSDEQFDRAPETRGTDSESATKTPNQNRGVIQDSPGNPDLGFESDAGGEGNLTDAEMPEGWTPPADPEIPRDYPVSPDDASSDM
ncbi:hypothetical protein EHF33_11650 [Deinococcus psychrotolerans]|uniref:Uncharacterized protein n=2 Tax=Deinococcus TaxID=1298 RepID=A0A553UQB9_9DEIO|nr:MULTISPECIES: hypothetical protein [Deinococcus]AZI43317.1 hypothetical protein EHF33_11650 [Deinococcus psychrotolerans]TSA82413.1 hypothetical protein FNU79_13640 [Deinococcus detaillensis]